MKKLLTAAAVTAAVAGLSAAPALAGEITGSFLNGKGSQRFDQNQGRSWCSFSGLNDDPTAPTVPPLGENGPGGRSQSFGQENKLGISSPHEGNPGTMCNPNRSPLPPRPHGNH